jgi:hypothetical protein
MRGRAAAVTDSASIRADLMLYEKCSDFLAAALGWTSDMACCYGEFDRRRSAIASR